MAAMLWWWFGRPSAATPPASPALWHLTRGPDEAYLLGTIHSLPGGSRWLGPQIEQSLARSGRLMLEVTGLDDESASHAIFERLGRATGLPPIKARLPAPDAARLHALIARDPERLDRLDGYKSWAAALLINASAGSDLGLSNHDAPERVLTARFAAAGKPVAGLETIAGQLGIFDRLPQDAQRWLLRDAIRTSDQAALLYRQLYAAWAHGDLARLEAQFLKPLGESPALRTALIDARNARWAETLDRDLHGQAHPTFIAVGAGHLVGPASLLIAMRAKGWTITRLQ